jgi:hypothetical protein
VCRAWTFVSALTICAAYFGRLGDARECELASYRASQILQHFIAHSPQAKQYDLILRKLSRIALGYINATENQLHINRGVFWFDLFRLTPAHLYSLEEEEESLSSSVGIKNRLAASEGSPTVPLNVDPLHHSTYINPSDDIFNFPDGAYKEFSNYMLMPEGLLFDQDTFLST